MYKKFFAWIQKYERHLSALSMVAGFVCDSIFFTRIDVEQTQNLLAIYTGACFLAIPLLHLIEARAARSAARVRWKFILPFTIQFALGGFWSAFVIFYGRSAVLSASWPFLILVFMIFIGSEYFHKYHERLVFSCVLFFFALYSCAIFEVPIYTGTIGTGTFVLSGIVAICVFSLFTILLRILGRERFLADVWKIRVGAFCVFITINIFYLTNILPPLPLSASSAGVYHFVSRSSSTYIGISEPEPWYSRYFGFDPVLHITPSESLYAYSSVFAPTALETSIVHDWQFYDQDKNSWITKSVIKYPITGGRDGGYRGYSTIPVIETGKWRVNVRTIDDRLIARISFIVEKATTPPSEIKTTLQ